MLAETAAGFGVMDDDKVLECTDATYGMVSES